MLLHLSAIISRLNHYYRLPVGLLVILFFLAASGRSLPAVASYQATPIIIDAFDQAPTQALSVACCSGSDSSAVDNGGVLGGERDIQTTMLTGLFGTQNVFAGPPLNSLYHAQQPLMTGWTRVSWDGNDDDPLTLDPVGLSGVDFTDSGNNSGLFVHIGSANSAANLVFTAYTDGANISEATLSLSGATSNQGFFIPFTSFAVQAGTGANFTNIGAFELFIDGSTSPGFQIFINTLTLTNYDFGDLPAAYNITTLADDGARHVIGDLYLGTAVDGEADGQESPNADGDDTNGVDDEDGITLVGTWVVGANGGTVDVVASGAGCLSGWIDWDNNNNFTGAGDAVIVMAEVAAGANTVSFDIPAGTDLTETFFGRFRLVPDTGASPDCSDDTPVGLTGEVINGEVEDHLLSPSASLSIDDVTVGEADGSAIFTVSLSAPVGVDVLVDFTTNDGTAVAPDDYLANSGTLTIPANDLGATISVTIVDDQLVENPETFTVNLSNAVNATIADGQGVGTITDNDNAPIATDDDYTTDEDTVLNIAAPGVLANDTDPDLDPLTAVLNTPPTNGAVSLNPNGSFVYTPTLNFNGVDSFTYFADDGFNNSNVATVTIDVTPVNDSLTAVDDDITANEDVPVNIDVLANDIDPDGDAQVVAVTTPLNGTATINPDNTVLYTPDANYYGSDSFQYTISDGVYTDTATVNITVNPVNDPPVINDEDLTVTPAAIQETEIITLTGSFTDEESGDAHSVIIDWGDGNSDVITLTVGITSFSASHTYLDDPAGPSDEYTIEVTVDDGTDSDSANATVTVTNVPPVLGAVSATPAILDEGESTTLSGAFTEISPLDSFILTVDWGDGIVENFNYAAGSSSFSEAHTYQDNYDPATIEVTLADDDGGSDMGQTAVTVNNLPPTADAGPDQIVLDGFPANFSGSASDPGAWDTLSYEWDFGDGANASGTLTPTHIYPTIGVYTATLTVTDDDGDNADDTAVVNVIAPSDIIGLKTVSGSFTDGGAIRYTIVLSNTGDIDQQDNPGDEFVDELPEELSVTGIQVVSGGGTIANSFNTVTWNGAILSGGSVVLEIEATILPGFRGQMVSNQGQIYYDGDNDGQNEGITYTDDPAQPGFFDPTTFTIQELTAVYLPIIMNNAANAPDLVITAVSASSNHIEVTIQNQGTAATATGFWVDFYIDPSAPPTGPNQLWYDLADEGLAWGVTALLTPGQSLTLVYSTEPGAPNQYFIPEESLYNGTLPAGTLIYAQVDSAREGVSYGGILETHEILGGPYNNIISGTAVTP